MTVAVTRSECSAQGACEAHMRIPPLVFVFLIQANGSDRFNSCLAIGSRETLPCQVWQVSRGPGFDYSAMRHAPVQDKNRFKGNRRVG